MYKTFIKEKIIILCFFFLCIQLHAEEEQELFIIPEVLDDFDLGGLESLNDIDPVDPINSTVPLDDDSQNIYIPIPESDECNYEKLEI